MNGAAADRPHLAVAGDFVKGHGRGVGYIQTVNAVGDRDFHQQIAGFAGQAAQAAAFRSENQGVAAVRSC